MHVGCTVCVLAYLSLCAAAGGDLARHTGTRVLAGDALHVEVMAPNAGDRYNRGTRFSPVAAVLRVWSGTHEFLHSPVEHDPVKDHAGLPSEFDLVGSPPGFAEAEVGDPFVKIGVGALRKARKQYRFYEEQEIVRLAQTRVSWGPSSAEFHQELEPVNGYGYALDARVSITGAVLEIAWALRNVGPKPFTTETYTHNFLRLGEGPVGPAYELVFPYEPRAEALSDPAAVLSGRLQLTGVPERPVKGRLYAPDAYDGPNRCRLLRRDTGQSVELHTDRGGGYTAIFATRDYFCPEQFNAFELPPGAECRWTRSYTFHLPDGAQRR